MTDWLLPALRFGVYADLLLLAGIAQWRAWGPAWSVSLFRAVIPRSGEAWLAGLGIVLAATAMSAAIGAMMGKPFAQLDGGSIAAIVLGTALGWAFLARMAALLLLLCVLPLASGPRHLLVAVLAALALTSLAWSGHAAADDGWAGSFHRLNDAVHLLAAAIWIGAIAGFALAAWRPGRSAKTGGLPALAQALRDFAPLGTVLVLLVAITGVVNLALISGWPALFEVWRSDYGRLLIAKIGLFFAMLAAAGLHRWYLVHALETAIAEDAPARNTLTHLRLSLAAELLLSVAILLLVARLGMMAP